MKKALKTAKTAAKVVDKNFWHTLVKPFFVIAPMANVTDYAFRQMFAKYGKPDVMWTEFVSADGLMSPGRDKLMHNLEFSKKEKPIVAQLFTSHPEKMKGAAALIVKLGFDGLDINMGCPDRAVEKQGGGAGMMKNPEAALKVLQSARDGVCTKNLSSIPVSVKTRIGYNKIDLSWIKLLLEQKLPALTVHLRTRKEMSDVTAHWEVMPEIIKMRNEISPETLIIGNGDVASLEEAREKTIKYGCDGVMIGRGIFGKPWFFENLPRGCTSRQILRTPAERLKIMIEHAKLFEKVFQPIDLNEFFELKNAAKASGKTGSKLQRPKVNKKLGLKNFDVMKKHFKAYVSGWDGAKDLRVELMKCGNSKELAAAVKKFGRL